MPANNERNEDMKKIKPRKVRGMLKECNTLKIKIKAVDIPRDKNGMPKLKEIG